MKDNIKTACAHCQKVTSENYFSEATNSHFCCAGCETVFKILNDHDLIGYYQFVGRNKTAAKRVIESEYEYLDRPETVRLYSRSIDQNFAIDFYLEGIHCLGCLYLFENLSRLNSSIKSSQFNLENNLLTLTLSQETKLSQIAALLEALGYKPHLIKEGREIREWQKKQNRLGLFRIGIAGAISGNIMLMAIAVYSGATGEWQKYFDLISSVMAFPSITFCAYPFYLSSWQALKQKRVSIDLPISLAIIIGSIVSYVAVYNHSDQVYFDSVTGLIFLLLSSRFLQKSIEAKAFGHFQKESYFNLESVKRYNPKEQKFEQVYAQEIIVGDTVLVEPGMMVPVDGELISSTAQINEALLTGEAMPRQFVKGEKVFQGTINSSSSIEVLALSTCSNTRMHKIMQATSHFKQSTSLSTLSDKIGAYFLYTVMALGLGVTVYYGLKNQPLVGIQRALTLFIVTCPCALAIGTPLSFIIAFKQLMKKGIILRDMLALEKVLQVKNIFIDKTGTLTKGEFKVNSLHFLNKPESVIKNYYFSIIYALEKNNSHPVARGIINYLEKNDTVTLQNLELDNYLEIQGQGVQANYNDCLYEIKRNKNRESNEFTTLSLNENDEEVAVITLSDEIKENASFTINQLKKFGFPITILSGDQEAPVRNLAHKLHIKHQSKLGPEDKAVYIQQFPHSMMIGDGANDALALKQAFLPVAVKGSLAMSLQVSEVYLANDNLASILTLFKTAKGTRALIYRNLSLSLVYNLTAAALALTGQIGPMTAALFMPLSSLTIILSNLWGNRSLRQVARKSV